MDKITGNRKDPNILIRTFVECIKQATDDDVKRYLAEFTPGSINGLPHQIHDWINGHLRDHINSDKVYTLEIKRAGWRGRITVDEENRNVYSIMRNNRLKSLRKEKRNRPHYLQTIVGILNAELEAKNKQLPLDGFNSSWFSQKELKDDYFSLFGNKINPSEGYKHGLILFGTKGSELYDVRICVVDKDLDVVEDKSLAEYIRPDYAELTGIKPNADSTVKNFGSKIKNSPLVKLRENNPTDTDLDIVKDKLLVDYAALTNVKLDEDTTDKNNGSTPNKSSLTKQKENNPTA